jgi:hypothetical protein
MWIWFEKGIMKTFLQRHKVVKFYNFLNKRNACNFKVWGYESQEGSWSHPRKVAKWCPKLSLAVRS